MTNEHFMGPPMSWYDPPEGHKSECNCFDCHKVHLSFWEVEANAKSPDFQCCKDEIQSWIDLGVYCLIHGGGFEGGCLECKGALNHVTA